jgi:hypothetical protein
MKRIAGKTFCFFCGALLGALVTYFYLRYNTEHVYLSVADYDRCLNAMILWKLQLPFEYVSAFLQVETFGGAKLLKVPLLEGRDSLGDIKVEFKEIRIEGNKVNLISRHQFYKGPDVFSFKHTEGSAWKPQLTF